MYVWGLEKGGGGGMRAVKEDSIYLIKIIWRRLNQAKRHQNQSVLACETARMGEYRVGETGLAFGWPGRCHDPRHQGLGQV